MRIDLPMLPRMDRAHLYPFQIAWQTLEFVQGAMFHVIFMDIAAGQRVRQAGATMEIKNEMIAGGTTQDILDLHWKTWAKYKIVFEGFVFQNAVVSMQSHWDWYLRRLGAFIFFARRAISASPLSPKIAKNLKRIGFANFVDQLEILRESSGLPLPIPIDSVDRIREMSLVRNIGLHNRWEVDEEYLKQTHSHLLLTVGDIRTVESPELMRWHKDLMEIINATWPPVAEHYVNAPDFIG
ncbi:MAG TPA: hypothetical protein VLA67_13540 [Nitrospiraceae bacterium]|nr:hypothetical protein [Nitrospiraceae bacterium]